MDYFTFKRIAEGYLHSPAEQIPFNDKTFDIITVAGSINWIDRSKFLPEARRVLKNSGWIIKMVS